ncbi:unnamed protein product [Heterobilharzia americana]|nr:unnamed protein product [Heterobilharzia americana]
MTESHLPLDKKIIYITPEELSQLPSDGPLYVLSTGDNTKPSLPRSSSQPSVYSQNISSTACVCTSLTCSLTTTLSVCNPSYFNNVSYQVPFSTNVIPYPPPMVSASAIPPYGLYPFQPPPYLGTHPGNWLTSGFQNSSLYNPGGNLFPVPTQYIQPYNLLPNFQPNVLSNAFIRTFNPYEPPPSFSLPQPTSKPSNTVLPHNTTTPVPNTSGVTCITNPSNANTTHRRSFCRSNCDNGSSETYISKTDSTSIKQLNPLRYTRLIYAPEPDFFTFDSTTGSFIATRQLTELEDRFENEVIARRHRATSNDPVRHPPERPVLSDSEHRHNCRASRLHRSKKSFHNDTVNSLSMNGNSDNDLTDESDGEVSKDIRLDQPKNKNLFTESTADTKIHNCHRRSRKSKANLSYNYETACRSNDNSIPDSDSQTVGCHSVGQRSIRQQREVAYKVEHPNRLHPDIWHNEANEFNDGPACSCKPKYRIGPLHNQYEGEQPIPICIPESSNHDRLYHYRVLISPTTNFVQPVPSKITHDGNDYIFDGFSLFLHYKLNKPPPCQVLRFNLLYDIFPIEEEFPPYFTVRSLDLLTQYVFIELLELLDLSWKPYATEESCSVIHLMPRFIRLLSKSDLTSLSSSGYLSITNTTDNNSVDSNQQCNNQSDKSVVSCDKDNEATGELLPVHVIMQYWLKEALTPVIDMMELSSLQKMSTTEWSNYIADLRGTLTCFPGKKPAAIRIDQLDRQSVTGQPNKGVLIYPLIVHMTYTPMKLSLTREPKYKCVLKNFMKLQYLMMNKPRISPSDRAQLVQLANELEEMEHSGVHRREITVEISCEGFFRTGIRPDIPQYALNLVSLVAHLRFHKSLESLENRLGYTFKDKSLLHQSLTHPSYRRTNFGTNQDHFQNSLVSCGPRILEYGDKLELYKAWRKKMHEERSNIYGNERLEFLGDAIVEVISSIHLFFIFPELSEGHLDAYRQAIVQNQHLAELAVRLGIHKYLLYTHSVDFCYDSTFIYARSDAFEALMAAITLDGGLDVVNRIFGAVLFGDDERIHRVWVQIPQHPLQAQCPEGDRSWATKVPMLKKLCTLEDTLGIKFQHLRVLARAMTIRKTGFNFYTLGDNQRLEFLGDSLLKYVSTDYLFRHFPRHHEGHLSLLKNSLVNKYTQASVCSELGLENYVIRREDNSMNRSQSKSSHNNGESNSSFFKGKRNKKGQKLSNHPVGNISNTFNPQNQNVKYRADLLEAFIGALFVDKDLTWVERFCQICFWPRLVEFILKQEWNDAKSKLQQCCLTFRSLNEDPEIAHYKVSRLFKRVYRVGVYFRGQCLATGQGRSVQQAQMEAAKKALELHQDTFRQLDFQRSVISRRYKQPYINKILNQVQNWDEQLVDYFISDKNTTMTTTTTTITTTVTESTSNRSSGTGIGIFTADSNDDDNNIVHNGHKKPKFLLDHIDSDDEMTKNNKVKRRCIDKTPGAAVCSTFIDELQQFSHFVVESENELKQAKDETLKVEVSSFLSSFSSASSPSSTSPHSSICRLLPQPSASLITANSNDTFIEDDRQNFCLDEEDNDTQSTKSVAFIHTGRHLANQRVDIKPQITFVNVPNLFDDFFICIPSNPS